MGMQRLSIDIYHSHEGVVDLGREFVEAAKAKGMTPSFAKVVNHPGEADEATTDLLAWAAPGTAGTDQPGAQQAP